MLGLLAETSVHPGAGRSVGVVDLPVAREAVTDYPVIVGSSLKGALRDKAESTEVDTAPCFGKPDKAGNLLVSDGRLLLLPVRSLTASFHWVTCSHLIERYSRDLARAGLIPRPIAPVVNKGSVLATGDETLFLEERRFAICGTPQGELIKAIDRLMLHEETKKRLRSQKIAVLCDDDFAWFVRYSLPIQARNVLEDGTKRSKNLWYEETLPPDTVMYAIIMGRNTEALSVLGSLFPESDPYLQAGGNETTGQGWFAVTVCRR